MTKHADTARKDRLKAALKANMGRRKAQKRIRADDAPPTDQTGQGPDVQEKTNG